MKSFSNECEEIHSQQEWGRYPAEVVIRFVARNYYKSRREDVRILDFGCGAGANTWYLAREGFDVYAFDGSESAVMRARKRLESEGLSGVRFEVFDGADVKYSDSFFDCVIDNVCIYANTKDCIEKMYGEVYRVLKGGGKLFTSCFGTKTEGFGTGNCLEEGTYDNIEKGVLSGRAIAHFYTPEEFEQTLIRAGFKNVSIDTMQYTDDGVLVEMFFAKAVK